METTADADRYAVFGHPIAHSKSPQIHALFAAQTGQRIRYDAICPPLDGFAPAVRDFIAAGGCGANVTVPFKLDAHALADTLSARAAAAGAVNTLSFSDGVICGDNTDGIGLVTDLLQRCMQPLAGARILVLGAGGAVRGALLPLLDAKPQALVIANRTVTKAEALADLFAGSARQTGLAAVDYDALADQAPFDVIINGTAASLHGDVPLLPDTLWQGSGTLAYDMMYGAAPTVFLQAATGHGARCADGLGMLVEQAAEAFAVWRGVRPQTQPVYDALRALLQAT